MLFDGYDRFWLKRVSNAKWSDGPIGSSHRNDGTIVGMTMGYGDRHGHRHGKWCLISNGWSGHDDHDGLFHKTFQKMASTRFTVQTCGQLIGIFFSTRTRQIRAIDHFTSSPGWRLSALTNPPPSAPCPTEPIHPMRQIPPSPCQSARTCLLASMVPGCLGIGMGTG